MRNGGRRAKSRPTHMCLVDLLAAPAGVGPGGGAISDLGDFAELVRVLGITMYLIIDW